MIMKPAEHDREDRADDDVGANRGKSRAREPLSTTADCRKNCMYGEIVVPIKPTTVTRNAGSCTNCGTKAPRATVPSRDAPAIARHDVAQIDQREDDEDPFDDPVGQSQHEQKTTTVASGTAM